MSIKLDGRFLASHDDIPELMDWLVRTLDSKQPISIDTETRNIDDLWDGKGKFCRLFQIGTAEEAWAIPAQEWHYLIKTIMDMVASAENSVITANGAYDQSVIRNEGWAIIPWHRLYDTIIMHRVSHPQEKKHGLKPVAEKLLGTWAGQGQRELDAVVGKSHSTYTWENVPVNHPVYVKYGLLDTMITVRLYDKLEMLAWAEVEHSYREATWHMENKGMRVDHDALDGAVQQWFDEKEAAALALLPLGFTSPGSSKVVKEAFASLGVRRNNFDKEVLAELSGPKDNPDTSPTGIAARELTNYRRSAKYLSSYGVNLRAACYGGDVIHPTINTMKARTSRSSITNPALQTIPTKGPARSIFIPSTKDHRLVAVDFDSQEIRIQASLSEDPNMIKFFDTVGDYHSYVAEMAGIPRGTAKTFNYAAAYGASVATMARGAKVPEKEMELVVNKIRATFPLAQSWKDATTALAEQRSKLDGYPWLELPYGRIAVLDKGREFTQGANTVIQGHGADAMKMAVLRLVDAGYGDCLVLVIHDEVLADLPMDEAEYHGKIIAEIMEDTLLKVPLTASPSAPLLRWSEAKE